MRYTAESLSRFMERHGLDRRALLKIYIFATGYTAPLPLLLRAYVQGRSVAGQMAGRARIVPIVSAQKPGNVSTVRRPYAVCGAFPAA